MKDFAEAANKSPPPSPPSSYSHFAVPKPEVHFVRQLNSTKIVQPKKMLRISDIIHMSKNISDFKKNLRFLTIETIEKLAMGQSEN